MSIFPKISYGAHILCEWYSCALEVVLLECPVTSTLLVSLVLLEYVAHILCVSSTHVPYSHTKYELRTPTLRSRLFRN